MPVLKKSGDEKIRLMVKADNHVSHNVNYLSSQSVIETGLHGSRLGSRAGTICRIFRYSNIRILQLLNYLANIIRISKYLNIIRIFKYSNTDVRNTGRKYCIVIGTTYVCKVSSLSDMLKWVKISL